MPTVSLLRLLAVLTAATLVPTPARAAFTPFFSAVDAGAGPLSVVPNQLPNSTAEADQFTRAAAPLGVLTRVDLGTATGDLTHASFAGGLTVALDGVTTIPGSPITAGVVNSNPNSVIGFNVTSSDGAFLRLTPDATNPQVTVATATFTFATPIQAFGVYVLGLGTAPGNFHMLVYDAGPSGGSTPYAITGDANGGAQFVGFTDPGANVTKVAFQLTGFTPVSRDIVGFDGISFVAVVPEPPALLFAVGGMFTLLGWRPLFGARASS